MSWTFRIVAIILGLGFVSVVVAALRPHPVDVEVAMVTRAPLDQKVIDEGKARVRERYTVSAPVAGTLARIELHEGDVVDAGVVLARLLPKPSPLLDPRARQVAEDRIASSIDAERQAQATTERAEAASEAAASALKRSTQLSEHGANTGADLEQAQSDARIHASELESAHFAERVAAHEIEQARSALATFRPGAHALDQLAVTSPVRGQVLHVLHQSEGIVDAGTPLIEVGDRQALELVVDVLSQDASAIRSGMAAQVVHWGGDKTLNAKVRRVEPAAFTHTSALGVDEQRVNVVLDLISPPQDWLTLGDGFAVEIEITIWSKPDVLQVPTSALFRDREKWAVFAVENDRAAIKHVEPGHRGALQTEIAAGLQPNEILIVHPGAAVRAGVRVQHR